MNIERDEGFLKREEGFLLLWVLASSVGVVLAIAIFRIDGSVQDGIVGGLPNPIVWSVMGAVLGASIGTAQWLVLRGRFPRASWWVLASTLGGLVGGALLREASIILFGVSLGIAQGLVLIWWRGFRALLWVLASSVGFVLGIFISPANAGGVPYYAIIGALYGAITGSVLIWLWRQPAYRESSPSQAAE
jgi:hypothetical protein